MGEFAFDVQGSVFTIEIYAKRHLQRSTQIEPFTLVPANCALSVGDIYCEAFILCAVACATGYLL